MPDQFFYYYETPGALEEIDTGIRTLKSEISNRLGEVTGSVEGRK